MQVLCTTVALVLGLTVWSSSAEGITPEQAAQLPAPADHPIDFSQEIKPIFESSCVQCHGHGKGKGGMRLDTRETLLKGGDSGATIVPGSSAQSLLIALVQGFDPDNVMPQKGTRLTQAQIALLRAWIDQGAKWDPGISFGPREPANLKVRLPQVPDGPKDANPIDRFLLPYFAAHKIKVPQPIDDRLFARRAYLDVIGLLPPPDELKSFLRDHRANKRALLVERLLGRDRDYAIHWLSFWNDLLRNDYQGTGYIDGGREQITKWLFSALRTNLSYDQFVAQLVNPVHGSEGFTKGIVWRGVVNASQTPQMQAAQNISQVFMGVNLKCASCHDSFINDLTLADAYGLAGIYAEGPLEMVRCDKPTGQVAALKFLYKELGEIDPSAAPTARLERLAQIITQRQDGRLTRTIVNRLWQRFMGRGLVEPADDMEKAAWDQDLLDWLAEDFASHGYDVKWLIERILTSRAYQMPAINLEENQAGEFVFRGPAVRRLSAEEFRDAITSLTGVSYPSAAVDLDGKKVDKAQEPNKKNKAASKMPPATVRCALVAADPLSTALGRPNRDQVVTERSSEATTLQALELTNGKTLADLLKLGAEKITNPKGSDPAKTGSKPALGASPDELIRRFYVQAVSRQPTREELQIGRELAGKPSRTEGVEDLLWAITMLPEFQLIY
jgi:mono/diheme cytochrome c family protein